MSLKLRIVKFFWNHRWTTDEFRTQVITRSIKKSTVLTENLPASVSALLVVRFLEDRGMRIPPAYAHLKSK